MTSIDNMENINFNEDTVTETAETALGEEKKKHSHHHHSSGKGKSHRHHHHHHRRLGDEKHHSHHHKSGEGKSHHHHHKSRRKKVESSGYHFYTTEYAENIPVKKTGIISKFKELATSLDADTKDHYVRISRRILFCIVIAIVCTYSIYTLMVDDRDNVMWMADFTPSETSQLKGLVTQLEDEKAQLELQLNAAQSIIEQYQELYGELPGQKNQKHEVSPAF